MQDLISGIDVNECAYLFGAAGFHTHCCCHVLRWRAAAAAAMAIAILMLTILYTMQIIQRQCFRECHRQ